tara:strand:+ start:290 stop:2278 length:1989 start_codon:yes stop_codon:yes gene_type:complete
MKKYLPIILILMISLSGYSQITTNTIKAFPSFNPIDIVEPVELSMNGGCGDEVLWFEDFGNPIDTIVVDSVLDNGEWTYITSDTIIIENVEAQDIAGFGNWRWTTDSPEGQWSENAGVIESETADNGFMIMEADFYNTHPQNGVIIDEVGENPINAEFMVGPIDLSASTTDQLVLQFYSNYRICCYYSPSENNDLNVYIGTADSTGVITWNDLNYIEGETFEVNVEKETFSQIPLGAFAPNTENVYFKFEWVGTHYFWMIDDLSVIERPAFDLKMQSSWLTMEDPENIEYYSIPESQMPDEMLIGAEIYNYGYNDDTYITLTGSINGTSAGTTIEYDVVEPDSTVYVETDFFDISMLTVGTYDFTAEITSSGDECTPEDNTLTREFVISENTYSIGGLYDMEEWTGTGWPGGDATADGLKFANYFDIKESTVLSSITIEFDTSEHPTSLGTYQTEAGGEIIAYVCDTTGIFNPLVESLDIDLGGIVWQSDFMLVEQNNVDWGHMVIDVPELELNPNAYYVVVEFYSNGLQSDILIRDDTSVPQPWWASLMFYPEDQTWYSDPNAASIYIGIDGNENIDESILGGIECFPNPANDYLEITSSQLLNGTCNITIYNMLGEKIRNYNFSNFGTKQNINLDKIATGSYIIAIENLNKISRHKLIIK